MAAHYRFGGLRNLPGCCRPHAAPRHSIVEVGRAGDTPETAPALASLFQCQRSRTVPFPAAHLAPCSRCPPHLVWLPLPWVEFPPVPLLRACLVNRPSPIIHPPPPNRPRPVIPPLVIQELLARFLSLCCSVSPSLPHTHTHPLSLSLSPCPPPLLHLGLATLPQSTDVTAIGTLPHPFSYFCMSSSSPVSLLLPPLAPEPLKTRLRIDCRISHPASASLSRQPSAVPLTPSCLAFSWATNINSA